MVVDVSSPKVLTRAYGILRVGMNLGWAAGPAIGGYLLVFLPYSWLFGITASLSAINLVFVIFLLRESHGRDSGGISIGNIVTGLHDKRFLVFIGICLLLFLVMGQMVSTLSVFTVDRAGFSTSQYGLLLTTNGLIVVVLQYPSTLITGKIRRSTALLFGCIAYAIGYFFMGWVTGFWIAVSAMVIITIGEIIFSPVSLSVVGEISPPAFRGRYLALFGLSEGLGFSLASLIGGGLLDAFPSEGRLVWGTIAAIAVIAGIGFFFWGKLPLDNRSQVSQ
jgi:MFS family permease